MKTMIIAQITDLHIGMEGEQPNGIDVRANFLNVLKEVKAAEVDGIVVSGDLCLDVGVVEIYQWIKSHLDRLETPYWVMSGNHDAPEMLADVFGITHLLQKGELFYEEVVEGVGKMIFLDSTTGKVSSKQLTFLKDGCKEVDEPILLFVHHPPALAGVAHMDTNYALQNIEEVQTAIEACPSKPKAIFCGHYHCERTIALPHLNTNVFITPSSAFFQLNPDAKGFEMKSRRSTWRKILWDGKGVKTSVHRLGNNVRNEEIVRKYYEAWRKGDKSLLPLAENLQHFSPHGTYLSRSAFLEACWQGAKPTPPISKVISAENCVTVLMEAPTSEGKSMLINEWFEIEEGEITKVQVIY